MSDTFDPYGAGRERIRESVKWLYGVATSIAAVLLATVTWTALPKLLEGNPTARCSAGVLLVCVVVAVGATLRVLSSKPYGLRALVGDKSLRKEVNSYKELFSDSIRNVGALRRRRRIDPATFQRVLSFAAYLDMRRRAIFAQWAVAIAAIVGAAALGVLLHAISAAEDPKGRPKMVVSVSPASIEALAKALRD